MQGAAAVTSQNSPDAKISEEQQSAEVRVEVFAGAHPAPPQTPHPSTQHTSALVDWMPSSPLLHTAAVVIAVVVAVGATRVPRPCMSTKDQKAKMGWKQDTKLRTTVRY